MNNAYVTVLARAVDIVCCTIIWRNYDVTISSMCGLELRKPNPAWWAKILGGMLNKIQANHCELAIQADLLRATSTIGMLLGEAQ
jgi:hypothetical protein